MLSSPNCTYYKNYIAIIKYITSTKCLIVIKLICLSFREFIIFRQRFAIRDVSLSECDNDGKTGMRIALRYSQHYNFI